MDRRSRAGGQALVEMALILPVLIALVLGTITAQTYVVTQNQLQNAVTNAVLVGARDSNSPCVSGGSGQGDVQSAFNAALGSREGGTGSLGSSASISIACSNGPPPDYNGGILAVTGKATVDLSWSPIFSSIPIKAVAAAQIEPYRCVSGSGVSVVC